MNTEKGNIISKVKQDILSLQGFKRLPTDNRVDIGFHPIERSFPNGVFPIGCVHECIHQNVEDAAATSGFIAGITGKLMQTGGACAWISASRSIFPAALKQFGVEPDQIIFIDLNREKDVLYATEEALKCHRLTAVLSEIKEIDFTASRRFQLAAAQSRVTGFLLRSQPRVLNSIASVSRWHIRSIASMPEAGLPGVGFPRWQVDLLKVRNGHPGSWQIEWTSDGFTEIRKEVPAIATWQLRKVV